MEGLGAGASAVVAIAPGRRAPPMLDIELDKNLSPIVRAPLEARGHRVRTVVEQGWSGAPDADLLVRVRDAGEFLITADKGFAEVRARTPRSSPGIRLVRRDLESVRRTSDCSRRSSRPWT